MKQQKNRQLILAGILLLGIALPALFPSFFASQDPYQADLKQAFLPPDGTHWFGTDKLGRDVFSRIIYGTRTTLFSAVTLVCISVLVGMILGTIAGYFGGIIDVFIMRMADMMLSFPGMVLAIAAAGILGAGTKNAVLALTIVNWGKYARLSKSLVLKIQGQDYVSAAEAGGARARYLFYRYLIPGVFPTILITAGMDIGTMILELAGLSFLGFGAQPPQAEWGLMLSEGRAYIKSCPWLMLFPGAAVFLVVFVCNLAGDALKDKLDSKMK